MGRFLALLALVAGLFTHASISLAQRVSAPYLKLGGSQTVALAGDDQAVAIGTSGVIYLTSDDATAANRTFTLSGCNADQILVLVWNDADEGQLVDTGTVYLSANWEPTNIGTTLTLYCNGSNYYEISRSVS